MAKKASKTAVQPPKASQEPSKRQPRYNGLHPGGRPYERPSPYDDTALQFFFDRLSQGLKVSDAADHPDCPNLSGIYIRAANDTEFQNRFLRARELQQDALVDQTLDIADKATHENWQVARLRIQAIQWRAARLASKVYGEKSQLNLIVNDALSDRLTLALKRQKELAASGTVLIEGVAEPVEAVLPDQSEGSEKG